MYDLSCCCACVSYVCLLWLMFVSVVVVLLEFVIRFLWFVFCLCVALALLMRVSFDQLVYDVLFHCSCKVVDFSSFVVRVVFVFRIVATCL